jgi:adenylosuccinate synthase
VVVGGQFGSEGKGAIAGFLAADSAQDRGLAVRVAGPNAGHSVLGADGRKWALRSLPVAAVTNPLCGLAIAAGSEVDPNVLWQEIQELEEAGYKVRDRLWIDPAATILSSYHIGLEADAGLISAIGSTGKGVGAARAERIWRRAATFGMVSPDEWHGAQVADTATLANRFLRHHHPVLVEGTQGYGLGLHTKYYPKVTSSDCRAIDFLGMAGISPWAAGVGGLHIWVVMRPYPIRVAGASGALAHETTWEALGLPPEYTTVTKKIRRVGRWDPPLAREAIQANGGGYSGPVRVALTMADQLDLEVSGVTEYQDLMKSDRVRSFVGMVGADAQATVGLVGTGPGTIVDLR